MFNIDFLIAGLICLLIVMYHFAVQNKLVDTSSRIFMGFIVVGILDIIFDILSSVLIDMADPNLEVLLKFSLTAFYLMQIYLPYGMFLYMRSLCDKITAPIHGFLRIMAVPPFVMGILIIANYWTGMFFSVNGESYTEGPFYPLVYIHALCYIVAALIFSIGNRKLLGRFRLSAICEVLAILMICVVIQLIWKNPLMIGFGIAMSISIFFFTINNPKEYTDNMTGVFDNRYFSVVVENLIERKRHFHVITVDFHLLKKVNTVYGNELGNQILVESARRLLLFSENGQVFRIHGNRFALITYSYKEYENTLRRIHRAFDKMLELAGKTISFPAIVCGITDGSKMGESDMLLSYMEYLASLPGVGGDSILIQDDERIMRGFRYANEVEAYLQTAIEKDLFEVVYQPVYSIKTGSYITLEALSRLSHPRLGPISPEVFINVAERNGQIDQIGCLQFERVCRFVRDHREMMETIHNIKFNLSPAELMANGHCEQLIQIIEKYDLPGSWFQFEITETVATEYSSSLYEISRKFTEAGIGLCLDDFGSGFANLNTVLKLPFHSIKLDRSLLTGIETEPKSALFYKNIVSVLKNMDYNVISEGVEKKSEVEFLSEWGVDMIQGYYFSKPLGEKAILELLTLSQKD